MHLGLLLITTVLVLGGLIATLGDRIGMRVGKARLSLFNLRPRQTATVVSVLTGSVISASTLGLLLITSEQLRRGLFEFEEIQDSLSDARQALEETQAAKADVETALNRVTRQKTDAEGELNSVIDSLNRAAQRETAIRDSLNQTRDDLRNVSQQARLLQTETRELRQERRRLLQQQASVRQQIQQRDREIADRDREIATREKELAQLDTRQAFLEDEIERLEREFVKLRVGNVAIGREQTIGLLVIRPQSFGNAAEELQKLLTQANRVALNAIWPDAPDRDIQILRLGPNTVTNIAENILDGQQYVVRVAVVGNYVVGEPCVVANSGEPCVEVRIQSQPNRIVFETGASLAQVSIDRSYPSSETLINSLNLLIESARLKASLEGVIILDSRLAGGLTEPVIAFLSRVQNYGEPLEIDAVAGRSIFTTGPLELELVASRNGQPLFRTRL